MVGVPPGPFQATTQPVCPLRDHSFLLPAVGAGSTRSGSRLAKGHLLPVSPHGGESACWRLSRSSSKGADPTWGHPHDLL